MSSDESHDPGPIAGPSSLLAAAELQDDLMIVNNDLEHLQTLLSDAYETLQAGFFGAARQLGELNGASAAERAGLNRATKHLASAVKALQFQDMSSQLIAHTQRRLRNCTDRLARDAFAGDEEGAAVVDEAPLRPNPVTQAEMNTGFIELF